MLNYSVIFISHSFHGQKINYNYIHDIAWFKYFLCLYFGCLNIEKSQFAHLLEMKFYSFLENSGSLLDSTLQTGDSLV